MTALPLNIWNIYIKPMNLGVRVWSLELWKKISEGIWSKMDNIHWFTGDKTILAFLQCQFIHQIFVRKLHTWNLSACFSFLTRFFLARHMCSVIYRLDNFHLAFKRLLPTIICQMEKKSVDTTFYFLCKYQGNEDHWEWWWD